MTSAISRRAAGELGLKVRERTILTTGGGAVVTYKDIILLELRIGNGVIPVKVAVVDTILGGGNDFLIGMDVIQCGDFAVSTDHTNGFLTVSFKPYSVFFKQIEDMFDINNADEVK